MPSMPAVVVAPVPPASRPVAEVQAGRRHVHRWRDIDGWPAIDYPAVVIVGGCGLVDGASAQGGYGNQQNREPAGAMCDGRFHGWNYGRNIRASARDIAAGYTDPEVLHPSRLSSRIDTLFASGLWRRPDACAGVQPFFINRQVESFGLVKASSPGMVAMVFM